MIGAPAGGYLLRVHRTPHLGTGASTPLRSTSAARMVQVFFIFFINGSLIRVYNMIAQCSDPRPPPSALFGFDIDSAVFFGS